MIGKYRIGIEYPLHVHFQGSDRHGGWMEGIDVRTTASQSLLKGMNGLKRSFDRRNAEIRKAVMAEFRMERFLVAQRQLESHVKEFDKMLIDLSNIQKSTKGTRNATDETGPC